jgi:hypothetical protein
VADKVVFCMLAAAARGFIIIDGHFQGVAAISRGEPNHAVGSRCRRDHFYLLID